MRPRVPAGPARRCTCFEGELSAEDAPGCFSKQSNRADADALAPQGGLIHAQRLSALKLRRQADALADGLAVMQPGPVALQAALSGVLTTVRPLAVRAGLAVWRDIDSHADAVCCADPVQLHNVLVHLVLRTLAAERAPGHVRIMVTLTPREAQLRILGRGAPAALDSEADRQELAAAEGVLHAMGGSLILEPRRAGYLPLCVALRALTSTARQHAA